MLRFISPAAALALLAATIPAAAQDDPYASCAVLTEDDAARLACFDATYTRQQVVQAEEAAEREAVREEVFGFRRQERELAQSGDDATITATVAEVLEGARRSQVLLMDNGQLWRESDGSTLRNRVREGWTAQISRHWSGAYEMRFEGRSGYLRVARVR